MCTLMQQASIISSVLRGITLNLVVYLFALLPI